MLRAHTSPLLEAKLSDLGGELQRALVAVLAGIPERDLGPQRLGAALGLDKVFAHRLLKAVGADSSLAVLRHAPGPEPLRRFLRAARRRGIEPAPISEAMTAVDRFHTVLREDVGDRSTLDAMLASWLPQARSEFELRRKQTMFKAQSQLLGSSAAAYLATVLLHPTASGERIDVVWIIGLYGLQRWRPDARTKLATRRFIADGKDRRPMTLEGDLVEGLEGLRLDSFCAAEPAELEVRRVGEAVHYLLGGEGMGPKAMSDLVLAEVNRDELPSTPARGRRPYVFAEVSTPTKLLVFDVLVHRDLYPTLTPVLGTYDTAFDGVVDVNDPTRAVDRLDIVDTLVDLGRGVEGLPLGEVPRHGELYAHVLGNLGWDATAMRAWRARIDFPLYGTQVVVSFDPPADAPPALS